ncbi:TetR/AcrR family transcriptional regulator [Sandaracinobacteroides saxicola]|uniref:TetR/AcrR family transcriptional regulator n=1 Tax=Sandaracinobacteroides saxicola TaxID=2759707 RepID=A0A7G5IHF2_9SPHN|nr:TetR/AcrR family transcriptional regulator [Sandaracinobacteroides saxicola]QMW22794.1 TetR/AcrR family transcriptional regulator [Sandaracinobacteroides saxicola]
MRARLLEAAIDCLSRLGYAATSTILVADVARVSRGAMLHHFASKTALMGAVFEHIYTVHTDAYARIEVPRDRPLEWLDRLFDTAWALFRGPTGLAQSELLLATRADPELAAVVLPLHTAILARSADGHAAAFAAAGCADRALSDTLLKTNVALLRGLAMDSALGMPLADCQQVIDAAKAQARAAIRAGRGA